jgi:hypothetical protein
MTLRRLSHGIVSVLMVALLTGCAQTQPTRHPAGEPTAGGAFRCDFDEVRLGQLPPSWRIAQTNPTRELAAWQVARDAVAASGANVFALTRSVNYDGTFNLAIAEQTLFCDLDLAVKVKAVSGEEDQGGGPIWRCQDENNYYICRINPLESNYRVYKVIGGKRQQLASVKVELQTGRWYTLRVTMAGEHIACYLDGTKLLEATDGAIPQAGHVGLWTKADAVTSFDDLSVAGTGTQ